MSADLAEILLDRICRSAEKDCREIMQHRNDMFQNGDMAFRIRFKEQLVIDRANKLIRWGEQNGRG